MASSPCFSLLLSIIAIVCLVPKCCISAPHPCCPGSQHVVSLMAKYIGTFADAVSKPSLCADAERVAGALKSQLNSIGECPAGGARTFVAEVEATLSTSADECALSLGFVRAMFDIAASASSHVGNNSEWHALSAQFAEQVSAIDGKSVQFNISIGKLRFDSPKGDHTQQNVPGTDSVFSSPAKNGSHRQ